MTQRSPIEIPTLPETQSPQQVESTPWVDPEPRSGELKNVDVGTSNEGHPSFYDAVSTVRNIMNIPRMPGKVKHETAKIVHQITEYRSQCLSLASEMIPIVETGVTGLKHYDPDPEFFDKSMAELLAWFDHPEGRHESKLDPFMTAEYGKSRYEGRGYGKSRYESREDPSMTTEYGKSRYEGRGYGESRYESRGYSSMTAEYGKSRYESGRYPYTTTGCGKSSYINTLIDAGNQLQTELLSYQRSLSLQYQDPYVSWFDDDKDAIRHGALAAGHVIEGINIYNQLLYNCEKHLNLIKQHCDTLHRLSAKPTVYKEEINKCLTDLLRDLRGLQNEALDTRQM